MTATLLLALLPASSSCPQGPPAEAAKVWTQAELERVTVEIQADLEEMRGVKFKRPVKVQSASKADFLAYVRRRQKETETPERRVRDETVAKMLGLLPPEMDLRAELEKLLQEQVGGFYDPGSDTFFIMESFGGDLARIILAHELTHALDDQYFDLDGKLAAAGQETDPELALSALFEGSGTSAMNQWTIQNLKQLDMKALAESADIGTKGLEDAPAFLWKPLIAAYIRGEGFLVRAGGMNVTMKAPALADLQQAFEKPPRSSEQILHPEKYWEQGALDEPRKIEFDAAGRPEGWTELGQDTLGELLLAILATDPEDRGGFDAGNPFAIFGTKFTNGAAEGWGGDRLLLLGKGDLRWLELVTVWDGERDAEEFYDVVEPESESTLPAQGILARSVRREEASNAVVIRLLAHESLRPASDEELRSPELARFLELELRWTAQPK